MNRTTYRNASPLVISPLTCGAGMLAGLACLGWGLLASADGPQPSRWSSAPVGEAVVPSGDASGSRWGSSPQVPNPAREKETTRSDFRQSIPVKPPSSYRPSGSTDIQKPQTPPTATIPPSSRFSGGETVRTATRPQPERDPAVPPAREKETDRPEQAYLVRLPPIDEEGPAPGSAAKVASTGPVRATVSDSPSLGDRGVSGSPSDAQASTGSDSEPTADTPRKLPPPVNQIDWDQPQVVIGPPQARGQAGDLPTVASRFAPTGRGSEIPASAYSAPGDSPAIRHAKGPTEAPGQFAQGYESGSLKSWEMPPTKPPAKDSAAEPQPQLSPIPACRILGLKPVHQPQ